MGEGLLRCHQVSIQGLYILVVESLCRTLHLSVYSHYSIVRTRKSTSRLLTVLYLGSFRYGQVYSFIS